MSSDQLLDSLKGKESLLKLLDETLLHKCTSLLQRFPQPIDEFQIKLETFLINGSHDKLRTDTLGKFEQYLAQESKKASSLGKRPNPQAAKESASAPQKVAKGIISETSRSNETSKSIEGSFNNVVGVTYSKRTNAGQVVQSLNPSLPNRGNFNPSSATPLGVKCKVSLSEDDFENVENRYRYMFTTLEERSRAMEKHLLIIQKDMCAVVGIEESLIQSLSSASQELAWFCGRICCDAEGKLNAASLMLEGSYRDSKGKRVALDVSELGSYSFFPGQIILVEGINSSGNKVVAKRVIDGCQKPKTPISSKQLMEFHHSSKYQGGDALEIMVACGPFTTADNLEYAPLLDLLRKVLTRKPDVLVLVGPFVDISQPLLGNGGVTLGGEEEDGQDGRHEATYEMVFVEKIVRDCIQALFNSEDQFGTIHTNIVLVPSLLDGHHEFVFPQPPFGDRDKMQTGYFEDALGVLNIPFSKSKDPLKRVHLLPNPTMFRVNETLFAICSNDVLFQLTQEENNLNLEGQQRLSRLAGHILKQQSFAPHFPPNANGFSQLDFRHYKNWLIKVNPDILITPSRLSYLAKEVDGTIVVNPGSLARGVSGGTYAEITIHPVDKSKVTEGKEISNDVLSLSTRCKVDVVRI